MPSPSDPSDRLPPPLFPALTPEVMNAVGAGHLPGFLGVEILEVADRRLRARLAVEPHHLAPNGFLHAATVIALADTCCGYGCAANLPEGASGFTTIELKTNFIATLMAGALRADAELVHGGRTTQLWDARVTAEDNGRLLALFRCTQLVLRPR
ncbi:MAG: PaaI family thioesterase [Acidimicrobiales bacterium]